MDPGRLGINTERGRECNREKRELAFVERWRQEIQSG
jgi:hypothetical protein